MSSTSSVRSRKSVKSWSALFSLALFCIAASSSFVRAAEKTVTVRREKNLDFWDSDTLSFHLDDKHRAQGSGYDVVVLFYVTRDPNVDAVGRVYNKIANLLKAGTEKSNLVMALFDCEANYAHGKLCEAVNVKGYPTIMYLGAGPIQDTDVITRALKMGNKDKAAGFMGSCPVPNGAKFNGNWQYGDNVLDWIKTMRFLSKTHVWMTKGWGSKFRLLGSGERKRDLMNRQLPIGISGSSSNNAAAGEAAMKAAAGGGGAAVGVGGGATASTADKTKIDALERAVDIMANETKRLERNVARSAIMIDSIFKKDDNKDVFATLHETDGWKSLKSTEEDDAANRILLTCALEVGMEYCRRVSKFVAEKVVDQAKADGTLETSSLEVLEAQVRDALNSTEPYCAVIDGCITSEMADEICRPATCPFQDAAACRYLNTCFDNSVAEEYREALGLKKTVPPPPPPKTTTTAESQANTESAPQGSGAKKKARWGFGI